MQVRALLLEPRRQPSCSVIVAFSFDLRHSTDDPDRAEVTRRRRMRTTELGESRTDTVPRMSSSVVYDVHMAINLVHRLVYFVPEAAEEYSALGVKGAGGCFGSRSAPMGAVPDEVIIATFYNFSPRAVTASMPGVWEQLRPRHCRRHDSESSAGRSSESVSTCRLIRSPKPGR